MTIQDIINLVVGGLAALGLAIDLSPIKLNPYKWLFSHLGKLLNSDLSMRLDELNKKQTELADNFANHEIVQLRKDILSFADSCRNGEKHSKEEFNHVFDSHNQYERILAKTGKTNGLITASFEYIKEIYQSCLKENKFI